MDTISYQWLHRHKHLIDQCQTNGHDHSSYVSTRTKLLSRSNQSWVSISTEYFLNVGFKIRFLKEGGGKIPHTQLCSQLMVVEVVGHGRFKNIAYYRTEIVHVLL